MAVLSNRIPGFNPTCKICGQCAETIHHFLFLCAPARAVWFGSPFSFRSHLFTGTIPHIIQQLYDMVGDQQFSLVAAIMWSLWKARNSKVFQAQSTTPSTVLRYASNLYIPNLQQRTQVATQEVGNIECLHEDHPNASLITGSMVMCDGSWNLGGAGWGIVYYEGMELKEYRGGPFVCESPFHAEASALYQALLMTVKLHIEPVRIYSDCLQLVNLFQECSYGTILDLSDCTDWRAHRTLLNCQLLLKEARGVTIQHIPREYNTQAHLIANVARLEQEHLLEVTFPNFKPP